MSTPRGNAIAAINAYRPAERGWNFRETPAGDGTAIAEFSGKELIQGEPDASSFPSGGDSAQLPAAVAKVLQRIMAEHEGVIFNGNGYSPEWHEETADVVETILPDDLWPLPTYREMLFIK